MYEIVEKIEVPALLEQLAEECAELGKAALKLSRILRRENPTPVTHEDAVDALAEESADVSLCLNLLKEVYQFDTAQIQIEKYNRWIARLNQMESGCSIE